MLPREMAGEVQTPVTGAAARDLAIGDRVWLRHTKAGELERAPQRLRGRPGRRRSSPSCRPTAAKGRPSCDERPAVDPVTPVAELEPRRELDARVPRAPDERRRGRRGRRRRPRARADRQGGRRRAQLHRHRRDRGRAARPRRDSTACSHVDADAAPRHARRRHPPVPAARPARPARPRAREHGRHRPADDRRRDLDRHARHRRALRRPRHADRRRDARDRRRRAAARRARARTPSCCPPCASGSARSASSSRSRCSACRRSCCTPSSSPEPFDEVLDTFEQRAVEADHFEFYWFPHTDTAMTKTNTRLPADAARRSRRRRSRTGSTSACMPNGVLGVKSALGTRRSRAATPADQPPRDQRLRRPRVHRPLARRVHEPAHRRGSARWSTRCRAPRAAGAARRPRA